MIEPTSPDAFTLARQGELLIIEVSPALETFEADMLEGASALLMQPIDSREAPLVLFDLGPVRGFGSAFVALMLRCWKQISGRGGQMALCCPSDRVRELLRITALDTVWPIYDTRPEAVEAMLAD